MFRLFSYRSMESNDGQMQQPVIQSMQHQKQVNGRLFAPGHPGWHSGNLFINRNSEVP